MKKVLCNMNHYYDADKFSTCPHCARAKAFLERTAQTAQHAAPPAQDGPAKGGYWSLDDLRGKTSLPDTPAPGFSAPLPQEPSGLNIMHTTPLFQPDEMPLPVPPVQDQPHCPSCGAQLRKQQPFCPFCGARTDEPAPPAPAPVQEQPPRCPSCGAQLRKRQPFCPFCGVRIDEAVPPAPVQAQQPEPEPMSAPEQPFIPIPEPAPEPEQPSVPVPEPEPEQPVSEPGPAPGAEQPPVPASGPETDSGPLPETHPAPVIEPERDSVPVPAPASAQPPRPAFFPSSAPGDGRTHILYTGETSQIEPVVGWLVCVLGSQQGLSFPLSGGRNRIGRSADMDVCLSSDPEVSRNMHCILTFDPASEAFYLQADAAEAARSDPRRRDDASVRPAVRRIVPLEYLLSDAIRSPDEKL